MVEVAFKKVPAMLKVNSRETSILEKRLAKRLLPKELNLNRKQGFSVPIDDWLRGDEGHRWFRLWSAQDSGLLNREFIQVLMNGEFKGRSDGARLWALGVMAGSNIIEKREGKA